VKNIRGGDWSLREGKMGGGWWVGRGNSPLPPLTALLRIDWNGSSARGARQSQGKLGRNFCTTSPPVCTKRSRYSISVCLFTWEGQEMFPLELNKQEENTTGGPEL